MIYQKIRVVLDAEEDVLRTLILPETCSLEDLHNAIVSSFGLQPGELASFYRTDDQWEQGEEIPLMPLDLEDDMPLFSMVKCPLEKELAHTGVKLIYVYDFMKLWTFLVERVGETAEAPPSGDKPHVLVAFGELPEEAPEKHFDEGQGDDFGMEEVATLDDEDGLGDDLGVGEEFSQEDDYGY